MLTDKLNQFIDNVNGQFIEVSDRDNIYQCYDLAALWVIVLGIPKSTIQHLYAYEVFTKPNSNIRDYFDLIPNTLEFIPEDGDIGVFDKSSGNVAGHIGVFLGGGTVKTAKLFEQNRPLGTNAHIGTVNYDNPKLLGVLRPRTNVPEPIAVTMGDQTKYDFGGEIGIQEMQAVRSMINDLRRDYKGSLAQAGDLARQINELIDQNKILKDQELKLEKQLEDCKNDSSVVTYAVPVTPSSASKTADTINDEQVGGIIKRLVIWLGSIFK